MGRKRNTSPQTKALLAVLMEHPRRWTYGYELSQQTGLKAGTLYPLLMRLSDQGLLESDWRESPEPGKPPRHVYRLAPGGLHLARGLVGARPGPARRRTLIEGTA